MLDQIMQNPVVALAILAVILVFYLSDRSKDSVQTINKSFRESGPHLNTPELASSSIHCRYQFLRLFPYSRYQLELSLDRPMVADFRIFRAGALENTSTMFGISRKLNTGDPQFDSQFYVQTTNDEVVQGYLSNPKVRLEIIMIFNLGFEEVFHNSNELGVRQLQGLFPRKQDQALLNQCASLLVSLGLNLPKSHQLPISDKSAVWYGSQDSLKWHFKTGLYAAAFGWIGWWYMDLRHIYPPVDPSSLENRSLIYSVPAFLLYVYYVSGVIRKSSESHIILLRFVIIWGAALFAAGVMLLRFANGYLDSSEITTHEVTVISKFSTLPTGRYSARYILVYPSWDSEGTTKHFHVTEQAYGQAAPNRTTLTFKTRDGRFGFEWIEGVSIHL